MIRYLYVSFFILSSFYSFGQFSFGEISSSKSEICLPSPNKGCPPSEGESLVVTIPYNNSSGGKYAIGYVVLNPTTEAEIGVDGILGVVEGVEEKSIEHDFCEVFMSNYDKFVSAGDFKIKYMAYTGPTQISIVASVEITFKIRPIVSVTPNDSLLQYCRDEVDLNIVFNIKGEVGQTFSWELTKDDVVIESGDTTISTGTGVDVSVLQKPNATAADNGIYILEVTNMITQCYGDNQMEVKIGEKVKIQALEVNNPENDPNNDQGAQVKGGYNDFLFCNTTAEKIIKMDWIENSNNAYTGIYWFKGKGFLGLDESKYFDTTTLKKVPGYIGNYTFLPSSQKEVSTMNLVSDGQLDLYGDGTETRETGAGALRIVNHKKWDGTGGTVPDSSTTDGWYYYLIHIDDDADDVPNCVYVDSFFVRYSTFDNAMVAYVNNERTGKICGGTQDLVPLELRNIPEKDIYGYDLDYDYGWFYLTDSLRKIQYLSSSTNLNIAACNTSQEIAYTPLFILVKQGDDCDCPWNADTSRISQFITNSGYDQKIIAISKSTFLSDLEQSTNTGDKRADSLYVPVGQYPLPKLSFNISSQDGTTIKRKLDGQNVDDVYETACANTVIRDTTFSYTLCTDSTLYIKLVDEGIRVSPFAAASSIELYYEDGREITSNANGVYEIDTSGIYYYKAETSAGCTPISNKLNIKSIDDAVVAWYDKRCVGDTVRVYLKGGLNYTISDPIRETKDASSTLDTVIFDIPYEVFEQKPPTYVYFNVTTEAGCSVLKEILVDVKQVELSVSPSIEQEGYYGQEFTFEASGAYKFYWFPKDNLEDTLSEENYLSVVAFSTKEYFLLGYTEEGCQDTMSVKIKLINDPEDENFNNENPVITPNGDGINDGFVVEDKYTRDYYEVVIMNRWGDIVFREHSYENGSWKGKDKNGRSLPDGTYYYQINNNKGSSPEKRGFITILNNQ